METTKTALLAVAFFWLSAAALASDKNAASVKAVDASDTKPVKVPAGYRKKLVKDQVMYCTTTTTLGSRFPKQICVDEDGLRALAELRETNQQDLNRTQSLCVSAGACQVQ